MQVEILFAAYLLIGGLNKLRQQLQGRALATRTLSGAFAEAAAGQIHALPDAYVCYSFLFKRWPRHPTMSLGDTYYIVREAGLRTLQRYVLELNRRLRTMRSETAV